MIEYSLPGLYSCFKLNKAFIHTIENHTNVLRPDVKISSVYGCFPPAIWNGGRKMSGTCSIEQIEEEIDFWNSRNIECRFTFTNSEIGKEHIHDTFCNKLLKIANNGMNGVIVNSDVLATYIRKVYPRYALISSTTKCLKSLNELENECKKEFDIVVLDYSLNHSDQVLALPNSSKLEILVNAYCRDDCPERKTHYEVLSKSQMDFEERSSFHECRYVLEDFYNVKESRKSFVTVEEVKHFYKYGINKFKIEGRTNSIFDVLESYIYYLIRPEYADCIRLYTLRKADEL